MRADAKKTCRDNAAKLIAGLAGLLLIGALALLLLGTAQNARQNEKALQASLGALRPGESVTLNEVVPFAWDSVYTFAPYTTREEMEAVLGFPSRGLPETVNEGMVQLVFVKDGAVAASVCGYAEDLGYRVKFQNAVHFGEQARFDVTQRGDTVVLQRRMA